MNLAAGVLKARHIGVRELKAHLSERLKGNKPLIVTEHGTPTRVILSYHDVLELIDLLDELQDRELFNMVHEGREAIKKGVSLIINTDAHEISQMDNMFYGVSVARRGWATPGNIGNTLPWLEFKKHFNVS